MESRLVESPKGEEREGQTRKRRFISPERFTRGANLREREQTPVDVDPNVAQGPAIVAEDQLPAFGNRP